MMLVHALIHTLAGVVMMVLILKGRKCQRRARRLVVAGTRLCLTAGAFKVLCEADPKHKDMKDLASLYTQEWNHAVMSKGDW